MDARAYTRQLRKAQGQVRHIEPKLATAYHGVLRQQAREASAAYEDAMHVVHAAAADPARNVDIDALLATSPTVGDAVKKTQADRERIAEVTLTALTADPEILASVEERIQSLLLTQAGKQADRLVAGSRDVVASVIEDSLNNGWTVPETAKAIRAQLEQVAPYRATMLARTDLIGISNGTSQVAALSIGDAPEYKQWLTAGDDRVRDTHQEAEGQVAPNDQPFSVGDSDLFYPGDPEGPDDEVCNCRCTLIYADGPEGTTRQHSDLLGEGDGMAGMTAAAVMATSKKGKEIAAVAAEHVPEGGYGDTYWRETDGTVMWISADWTSNEEAAAAEREFLSIGGVQRVDIEAESGPPTGSGWEKVYGTSAMTAAAVDLSAGSMIALYPRREEAYSLAQEGGQDPEMLHCTLVFFPQPPNVNLVAPMLAQLAQSLEPLRGQVGGMAMFDAGADGIPLVALPDVVELNELRAAITMSLSALGVDYSESHGFVPHITVAYVGDPSAPLPNDLSGIPLTFEGICLEVGRERMTFPFQNVGLVPYTAEDIADAAEIEPFGEEVYDEGVGEMGTNIRASMITALAEYDDMKTITAADFSQTEREKLAKSGEAMPDGSYPITNGTQLSDAIQAFGRAKDQAATKAHIIKRAKALGMTDKLPTDWSGSTKGDAVVAAVAAPFAPPPDWFSEPRFAELTPLTVTADGQVYGHLAPWGQCHTGLDGRCTMAPRGLSYDYFHVGALDLADGSTVKAGKVTVGTGHAPLTASRASAAAHYDNTGHVVAFVRAGEDEHGPWIVGSVKSDATQEQIRDLRMNGPSGDWRRVRFADGSSRLELVGVLAVPVQGFPVAAMAASAAGEEVVTLIAGSAFEHDEPVEEAVLLASLEELGSRVDSARGRPAVTPTEHHMAATAVVR